MRLARPAALAAALVLLVPATASAVGFGPTTAKTDNQPVDNTSASAFVQGNKLKLTRFAPDFQQAEVTLTAGVGDDLDVVTNARGDALFVWGENGGATHVMSAVFWPASSTTPNAGHQLLTGSMHAYDPQAVLDPDGSATIVWTHDQNLRQVTTQDAGAANPWGQPTTDLVPGGGPVASLPDGRAVMGIAREVPITNPTPGKTRFFRVYATTRAEGQPFKPPATLEGDPGDPPARGAMDRAPVVAISPAGRALVSWISTKHNGSEADCDFYERRVHAALANVTADSIAPSFTSQVVSDPAPDPYELVGARASTVDDRLAVTWKEADGCWDAPNRPQSFVAAYTAPGQPSMTATGRGIPAGLRDFWWRPDGQLVFWTQKTNPIVNEQTLFDTGVPVGTVPDPGSGGSGGGGGDGSGGAGGGGGGTGDGGSGGGGGAPTPPAGPSGGAGTGGGGGGGTTVVTVLPTQFKASANGTVKMTTTVPSPGDLAIQMLAKSTGLVKKSAAKNVKVGSKKLKVKKAGAVTLTLKLTGKGKKTLQKKGKLKVSVVTTFKPAGGGKAIKTTKSVTFKLKK